MLLSGLLQIFADLLIVSNQVLVPVLICLITAAIRQIIVLCQRGTRMLGNNGTSPVVPVAVIVQAPIPVESDLIHEMEVVDVINARSAA